MPGTTLSAGCCCYEPYVCWDQVLASLAGSDPDLLHWHLMRQHGRALKLCIDVLGEEPGARPPSCAARAPHAVPICYCTALPHHSAASMSYQEDSAAIREAQRKQHPLAAAHRARGHAGYAAVNCGVYSDEDEEDFIGSDEEDDEDRERLIHDVPPWRPASAAWSPSGSALRLRRFAGP